jgi:Zn-dependent protease
LSVPHLSGTGRFYKEFQLDSLYVLPILLFSVVVHEVAHGWTALKLGDATARDCGRLTLNPIPHIDLIGSIIIPLLSFISAGSVFIAWAKPVPVNPANFRSFHRDDILVSVAGPVSNLLLAFCCTIIYVFLAHLAEPLKMIEGSFQREITIFIIRMFAAGITLNISLAVFNLIPVPPLDGSHVLSSMLPAEAGERFRQIGFFGIFIIIILMRVDLFRNFFISIVTLMQWPYKMLIIWLR